MMPWTGRTTFRLHPPEVQHSGGDLCRGPLRPSEEERHAAEIDERDFEEGHQHLRRGHEEVADGDGEEEGPLTKRFRGSTIETEDEYTPRLAEDETESLARGEIRPRDDDEMSGPSHKRHRSDVLDFYLTSVEKVMAAKLKRR